MREYTHIQGEGEGERGTEGEERRKKGGEEEGERREGGEEGRRAGEDSREGNKWREGRGEQLVGLTSLPPLPTKGSVPWS